MRPYLGGSAFSTTVGNIEINLSTTRVDPGTLYPDFADNVGLDDTVVYSGQLSVSSSFSGSPGEPKAFDIIVHLQHPFPYDPAQGNLLFDVRNFTGAAIGNMVDHVGTDGHLASRAYSLDPNSPSATDVTTGADIIQLVYESVTPAVSRLVIPSGLEDTEAGGGSGILNRVHREQALYEASLFPAHPIVITEFSFRPNIGDGEVGRAFSNQISALRISLSTSTKQADNLSSTFADNVGADATVVLDSPVVLTSGFTGPADGPKDFDVVIPFDQPFLYDPAGGNLLVDIKDSSGEPTTSVDAANASSDKASRVVAVDPDAEDGVPDTGADVLQIQYFAAAVDSAPVIYLQPRNQTVVAGNDVTFRVTATGANPLAYQWRFNGEDLSGQTNSLLILTNVGAADAGTYSVGVENALGTTESVAASLSVNPPAQIHTFDLSRSFSFEANPNGAWSYGYYPAIDEPMSLITTAKTSLAENGVPVQSWSLDGIHVPAVYHNGSGAVATSDGGQGVYAPGTTWFYAGEDDTTNNFGVIRLTIPAGGAGDYLTVVHVQSYLNGPLSGDTDFYVAKNGTSKLHKFFPGNSSYEYTNILSVADGDLLDFAVGRGADGHVYGSGLKIEVALDALGEGGVAPTIFAQPRDQSLREGDRLFLPVIAGGSEPLFFQWELNGVSIDGATNDLYEVEEVGLTNAGAYSVVVSNSTGVAVSDPVTVSVSPTIADGPLLVVPPNYADQDGASGSGALVEIIRLQEAYGSTLFDTGPIWINELRFRPSAVAGQAFTGSVAHIQINLSTTQSSPEHLDPVFAVNTGADDSEVFHGQLDVSSSFAGPQTGPKAFDIRLPLQHPFFYDPALGNLLVDIRNHSGSAVSRSDAGGAYGDQAGRAYALDAGATHAAYVNQGADILQIEYSVEPTAPTIIRQPLNKEVSTGSSASFTVTATGSMPLSYQWQFNDTDLVGATSRTLSVSNAQPVNAGGYRVVVANEFGEVSATRLH